MKLEFSTIVDDHPGHAIRLREQCERLLKSPRTDLIFSTGSRLRDEQLNVSDAPRSFLTIATKSNKVAAFIELRSVAGSSVFDEDLILNSIDRAVWDSSRTLEIAALSLDTRLLGNDHDVITMTGELLQRTSAYLHPLGIRRMIVRSDESGLAMFGKSNSAIKKLVSREHDCQHWLGVRLDAQNGDDGSEPGEAGFLELAA